MNSSASLHSLFDASKTMMARLKMLFLHSLPKDSERRHPAQKLSDEEELWQRRKDDNVGGEGG